MKCLSKIPHLKALDSVTKILAFNTYEGAKRFAKYHIMLRLILVKNNTPILIFSQITIFQRVKQETLCREDNLSGKSNNEAFFIPFNIL